MNLIQWSLKWGVPVEAIEDLRNEMGLINTDPKSIEGESEAAGQTRIRLEATEKGMWLGRNNVGAYSAKNPPSPGTRWGLCNDSPGMNKVIKSADLIGIRPLLIQQYHVGHIVGQFLSREIKKDGWVYKATERELCQLTFAEYVISLGGDAAFATGVGTL